MNIYHSKRLQPKKEFRENSNLINKINSTDIKLPKNNDVNQNNNSPKIKVDYKNSNYYYNDSDYFKDYPYKRFEYYNTNDNRRKYNIESNSSHITVENEDGVIKYIPKKASYNYNYNFTSYNDIPTQKNNNYIEISSHKNFDYYDDNDGSEYSENNENENFYYENDNDIDNEEYDNRVITTNKSQRLKYNQYPGNINVYLAPKTKIKNKNQNIISKAITHEVNFSSEKNSKIRPVKKKLHNCGNNTTTTNNTYNNNIYYINPINVKNKNKTKEKNNIMNNNKSKRSNNSKRNYIYKSVDITLQKKRNNKEKDYFKMNNIDKSKKDIYIRAAILIQSALRGYLVKIKLYNNINLYVCCKRGIDILQEIILNWENDYWKIFKDNLLNQNRRKSPSESIRARYKLKNNNKLKEALINRFRKDDRDSFNIINTNLSIQKDNKEKKLKNKLNEVIKENNELRNRLVDSRNMEIKLKSLIDENKKSQSINAIIMKDNRQLAKKLKDFQDYRNNRLFIENQYSIDLNQIETMQINELNQNNEIFVSKFKKILLGKLLFKKLNDEKKKMKEKFYLYRDIVKQMKNKEKEDNIKKEIIIKNLANMLDKNIKLLIDKNFWKLYYNILAIEKEYEMMENNKRETLKKLLQNKMKQDKIILYKFFYKFQLNNIKCINEEIKERIEKEKEEESETLKLELLRRILTKYEKNVRLIYKVILEKWNLKAKIIGIRTAARDKKKKRKQKKKNLRLLYNKNYGIGDNNIKNNYGPKFCQSPNEFDNEIPNDTVIEGSNLNKSKKILLGNKSTTDVNNSVNNLNNHIHEKEMKKKKNKSVNKKSALNLKQDKSNNDKDNNMNYNEESDEDSGDSFGLDNNSDC